MNKIIVAIIVIIIVILGGYFIFKGGYQPARIVNNEENKETKQESVSEQTTSQPSAKQVPQTNGKVITYTDSGYSPNSITIKKGETVIFKNQSSISMWPASAMHPTHGAYSGTSLDEHCPDTANSSFDACTGILPGVSWSFKFDKIGNWKFHDHLNSESFGSIIVE